MKNYFIIFLFVNFSLTSIAQNFVNGDLIGAHVGLGWLPTSWQSVDYADPVCLATTAAQATPDLCDQFNPTTCPGIAYSGSTFLSGLMAQGASIASVWQEGIQQTVSGFCIGCVYTVNFFQAVVKQSNALDTSGSWSVYIDESLAGISTPTNSSPGVTINLIWELRSISFVATSTTHTIKFLPTDDDNYYPIFSPVVPGALRMGIDSIFLTTVSVLPISLISFSASIKNNNVLLNWTTATEINNDYFTIEKSADGNEWSEMVNVNGSGNSSSIRNYECVDTHPYNGISYYRLKQTDYNGKFTYSENKYVYFKNGNAIQLFPNPATNFFIVHADNESKLRFSLFQSDKYIPLNYSMNSAEYIFDVSEIPAGIYFLIIEQDGNFLRRDKLVIE